jgi:NTP pyrophosphatase (non-canonical NTP hydrolase)
MDQEKSQLAKAIEVISKNATLGKFPPQSQFRPQDLFINALVKDVHQGNVEAGWWTDIQTGESLVGKRNVPEMLALIHSEVSEALEGYRKNKKDDHLPHRSNFEVELADAVIRIFDLAGGLGLDLGGAFVEKLAFNRSRADHKIENRLKEGGKKI